MADIFISYSSEDKERIRPLVGLLERQGWSVWWDRKIQPGQIFDQVIEEAITGAHCVLVAWSRESVVSNWVKTEAAEGVRQDKLIPVMIDQVPIPFEFRRIQAANLTDWPPQADNPEFQVLLDSINGMLGEPAETKAERHPPERQPPREPVSVPPQIETQPTFEPKSKTFFIVCGLLVAWLVGSIFNHHDWPGMNVFAIPLVTIILSFAAPVEPGTAVWTVVGLHIFNLLMIPAASAVHSIEQVMDAQGWLILGGITIANAVIVGAICRSRLNTGSR